MPDDASSAQPVWQRQKDLPAEQTDLATLRASLGSNEKPYQPYSWTDGLVDFLTPFLIFLMMLSVVWFLLDVRFAFTEEQDTQLRRGAFFFVMGIVALNRLVAQLGRSESAGYQFGMGAAVLMFAVVATQRTGSLARGLLDIPYLALGFNITILAFIWWVTNRLTRECCVDENPSSGEVGLLTSAGRGLRARLKALRTERPPETKADPRPPATNTMGPDLIPFDPTERRDNEPGERPPAPPPKATARLAKRHPGMSILYVAIPAMMLFAIGQRLVQHGGDNMVIAGNVYVGVYTVSALTLLMLSSLRQVRAYFRARRIHIPSRLGPFWLTLGTAFLLVVVGLGIWLPSPGTPLTARLDYREYDPSARGKTSRFDYHERETSAPTDDPAAERDPDLSGAKEGEPSGEAGDSSGSAGSQQGDQSDGSQGRQESQAQRQEQSESRRDTGRSSAQQVPQFDTQGASGIAKAIGIAAVVVLALFVLYGAARGVTGLIRATRRRGRHGRGMLGRLFGLFDRLFGRLGHLPSLPRRPKLRIDPDVAASTGYSDPLNSGMSIREKVAYSYEALCALAYDMGVPRRDDQTPIEFAATFPDSMQPIHGVACDLTDLYVLTAYSPGDAADAAERLRAFWRQFDGFRRRVVR